MDVRQLGLSERDLEALGYRVSKREDPAEPPYETASPSLRREGPGVRAWLWTLGTLIVVGWIARPSERLPNPVPANQPDTVFSSARAMSQLVDIARAPRPVGSPEHTRVRDHLRERLMTLGLQVRTQEQPVVIADSGGVMATTVRNVVARRAGIASTGTIVVAAHYDGPPLSPAAADNGLGLSTVLETVRALAAGDSLRNDIVFVLSDAKELGSLGIDAFLDDHPWAADVRAAVTVDALGASGPVVWRRPEGGSGALVAEALGQLTSPGAYSLLDGVDDGIAFEGELDAFGRRGVPALGLVTLGGRAAHGGPLDQPIAVSEPTLQHAGAQLLSLARALGSEDLSEERPAAELSYVSLPLGIVVHYSTSWGSLLAAAIALTLVMLFVFVRLQGGRWTGILAGSALATTAVAFGAGFGSIATRLLPAYHPEAGRLDAAVFEEGLFAIALVGLVVAGLSGSYALARNRYPPRELVLGALLIPFLVVLAATFLAPETQSVLQPSLLLAFGASVALVLATTAKRTLWSRLAVLVPTAAMLLFAVPGLSILAQAVTLTEARAVGAAIAVASVLLLPVIEVLKRPKPWALPWIGLLVASVAVLLSTPVFTDEADHPELTSLALLVDDTLLAAETSTIADDTPEVSNSPTPDTVDGGPTPTDPSRWRSSRWLTAPEHGSAWAESWVVDPSGRGTYPGSLLLPGATDWVVAGAGPEAFLPPPSVELTSRVDLGVQRIDVAISSGIGAEMVALRLPDAFPGALEAAGGMELSTLATAGAIRAARFWGRPPDGPLRATIRLHGSRSVDQAPLVFEVIEHHLRPREILGESFFQRADSVMADPSTGSDRLVQRVEVQIPTPVLIPTR